MKTDSKDESVIKEPLKGRTVLWVEDDDLLSDIIASKLAKSETKLFSVIDSVETFKILETETPDIIFLDILLPGMDGYGILEKLKADDKTKDIPVIILSNYGQESEVEKGLALGAEKFLIKSTITLDEVFQIAEKFLQEKGK